MLRSLNTGGKIAHFTVCWLLTSSLMTATAVTAQDTSKPATLAEIRQAVDWAKLPKPDDATRMTSGLSICSYSTKLTFAQAAEFFRKALPPLGWAESKENIPGLDLSQYLYVAFDKGGMRLSISGYKDQMSGLTRVTLQNSGNVDARKLPKMADAMMKNDLRGNQMYSSPSKPDVVAAFYRKELSALGWKEVPSHSAKFHAKEGRTILRFLQNAMEVSVVIADKKGEPAEVTCYPSVRHTFEPAEVAAHFVKANPKPAMLKEYLEVIDMRKLPRMEKAEKLDRDQKMVVHTVGVSYQAPGTLADVATFYRKTLSEMGWTEIPPQSDMDSLLSLSFEKAGYLVSVGGSQRNKADKVQVSVTNHGNVDTRQLPYPPDAEISCVRDDSVNCTTSLTKEAAFEFYRKELPKLGWKEGRARGQGTMIFHQNDVDLRLEIGTDTEERTSVQVRTVLRGME